VHRQEGRDLWAKVTSHILGQDHNLLNQPPYFLKLKFFCKGPPIFPITKRNKTFEIRMMDFENPKAKNIANKRR